MESAAFRTPGQGAAATLHVTAFIPSQRSVEQPPASRPLPASEPAAPVLTVVPRARDVMADLLGGLDLMDEAVAVLAVAAGGARVVAASPRLAGLLGLHPNDVTGLDLLSLVPSAPAPSLAGAVAQAAASYARVDLTTLLLRGDAPWLAGIRLRRIASAAGTVPLLHAVVTDRTQEATTQGELLAALHTDTVMHAPNRSAMDRELRRLLTVREPFGILVVGLEGVDGVNAHYGRWRGDELLAAARVRAEATVGEAGIVGRYTGCELVVIVNGLVTDAAGDLRRRTHRLADLLEHALTEPVCVQAEDHRVWATAGTACWPDDAGDAEGLLEVATAQLVETRWHRRSAFARLRWHLRWALRRR